jgi:hypothetical protein
MGNISGVRPICIGETWKCDITNAVILVTYQEVTMMYNTDNLCRGFQFIIYGAIPTVNAIWYSHLMEEYCGFLLIDSSNAFKEQYRMVILCNV